MNTTAPLSERKLRQAFENTPRGDLGSDFGNRVLSELDSPGTARRTFSRAAVIACWLVLAAAAVAVMATVDWRVLEPGSTAATIVGGGLLLCLGALAFLLRISRSRFMELLWRTLLD